MAFRALRSIWAFLLGTSLFAAEAPEDLEPQLRRLSDVYAVVEEMAADPVDPDTVFYTGAIPGMLFRLDPHSVFLDPEQFLQLQELQDSTQKGFGTVVSVMPGRVIVLQTLPETPSARAGLAPGDEILSINGIQLSRLTLDQLGGLLSQARQSEVTLDVRKPGDRGIVRLEMSPADVEAPSVDLAFLLRPDTGYVRLKSLETPSAEQLKAAIEKLGGQQLDGLVLDLRGNPGGVLEAGIECAALFLPAGATLVRLHGRGDTEETVEVPDGADPYRFPLAVLIDERTASAAEIVSGALRDNNRAAIVGRRSYGKGLVQSVFALSAGAAVALTTALYFTPDGHFIQRPFEGALWANDVLSEGGIEPNVHTDPHPLSRLAMALEATGAFTTYATQVLRESDDIGEDYEVSPALLDRFRAFLYEHNIQPGVSEWSFDVAWIRSRLRQEILNQAVGVSRGDEVEILRDPEVAAALSALSGR